MFTAAPAAFSQAMPTASRAADVQLGGGYVTANSDYVPNRIRGFGLYGDVDVSEHFGAELEFHQVNDPNPTQIYERSYELGVRYVRHYGRFHPYGKVLYGRGVFNFQPHCLSSSGPIVLEPCYAPGADKSTAEGGNLAYNIFVAGLGLDVNITRRINVRADFEYQDWLSGPGLSNGLAPTLFTIGAAYHFPAGSPR
jgi:hypothetical protein